MFHTLKVINLFFSFFHISFLLSRNKDMLRSFRVNVSAKPARPKSFRTRIILLLGTKHEHVLSWPYKKNHEYKNQREILENNISDQTKLIES